MEIESDVWSWNALRASTNENSRSRRRRQRLRRRRQKRNGKKLCGRLYFKRKAKENKRKKNPEMSYGNECWTAAATASSDRSLEIYVPIKPYNSWTIKQIDSMHAHVRTSTHTLNHAQLIRGAGRPFRSQNFIRFFLFSAISFSHRRMTREEKKRSMEGWEWRNSGERKIHNHSTLSP